MNQSSQLDRSKTGQTGPQQKTRPPAQPILGKINSSRTKCGNGCALEVNCANRSLPDYIRQDFEVHLGDKDAQFTQLECSPLFESIRRKRATPPAYLS